MLSPVVYLFMDRLFAFKLKKGNNIMSPVPNVYTISFNFVFIDASLNGVTALQ